MPHTVTGVYDQFDTAAEVRKYYKRCRTEKMFIFSDKFVKAKDPVCTVCGKKHSEHENSPGYNSNRSLYFPRSKKIAYQHYVCGWMAVLTEVSKLRMF